MKTFLDWSAYGTYGIGDAYSGIPATGGNYAKAIAVCMHSRDCQNAGKGAMCPSFGITGGPARLHAIKHCPLSYQAPSKAIFRRSVSGGEDCWIAMV
jgi:hypothetical protein